MMRKFCKSGLRHRWSLNCWATTLISSPFLTFFYDQANSGILMLPATVAKNGIRSVSTTSARLAVTRSSSRACNRILVLRHNTQPFHQNHYPHTQPLLPRTRHFPPHHSPLLLPTHRTMAHHLNDVRNFQRGRRMKLRSSG